MATGSQNMTTYNARTVTGSNSAASPAGALLLSGAGRADDATGDTWLFLDSRGGTSTPWGIKHDQVNNKIHIYGNDIDSVWTRMNTGDTYILGKVGIGYNPEESENSYKLYVNGTSNLNGATSINGTLTTAGAITAAHNSAHLYLKNTQWIKGTTPSSQSWSAVEYLSNDSSNNRVALLETTLDTSGNSQFNIFLVPNVANSTSWSGIILQKTNANVLTVSIAGSTSVTGSVGASTNITAGTYVYAGTYLQAKTHVYSDTGHFYMKYNNTWYSVLHNHGNGNISVESASGGLYIGYSNTTLINWLNGKMSLDSNGNLTMKNDIYYQGTKSNYRMIRFLDNTASTDGNGIIIGGAGYVGIGSGESGNQSYTGGGYSAGSETLVLSSDGDIRLLPTQQDGYNVAYETLITTNGLWVGKDGNTTREMDIAVRSGAGTISLWSAAAVAGDRGLWLTAHGSGGGYAVVCADTNNVSYLQGHRIGIKNTDAASGYGLSLYNGQYNGVPEYGMFFGGTGTFGKFGDVSADWATYFTMNRNDTRGWIFKSNGTSKNGNYNVASISGRGHFTGTLSPSSWIDGQRYTYAAYNIADYSNTGSYNPWMRATNTWSSGAENAKVGRWFSFGTLGSRFYWIGSTTTRTANSYDHGMSFDISNGILYATFSGNLTGNVTGNCSGSSGSCTGNSATTSKLADSAHSWTATEVYNYMTARVLKAGDTMSGNLFITTASGDHYFEVKSNATGVRLELDNSGSTNHGVWSSGYWNGSAYTASSLWMIYRNASGTVVVNGNCTGSSGSCTGNAATATNADKVDNYHASDLWRKDGGTWNGNANIACTPTANNQEYSFDLGNAHTGTYWHVWSGKNSKSILVCYNDNMNVSVPNGTLTAKAFSGPLTGDVTGNCSGSAGSVAWANVSSKPATATRWPAWSEVTSKPAVQNNLTSTSTTDMLSAAQGKALNDNKTNKGTGLAYTTLLSQTYAGTSLKTISVSNISSYNALFFACYYWSWWRGSILIPISEFKRNGVTVFFMIGGQTPEYANFKYVSDTSIQISTDYGHELVFKVWGVKTP